MIIELAATVCWISFSEIGYIIAIATILFGVTAVLQNPFIGKWSKLGWIFTILMLNWIGLLLYYFKYYVKDNR